MSTMIRNKLLQAVNPVSVITRTKTVKPKAGFLGKKHWELEGGVRYPGGIMYYPRPGEVEPEVTPSKLLRVERSVRLMGVPWFLKRIFFELGIGQKHKDIKNNFVTVVKNTPEINAKLWKIKHLVRITPITFPYGEPTLEDINHTRLDDSGVCVVHKKIAPAAMAKEEKVKMLEDKKRMNYEYIEKDCRLRWLNPLSGGF